MKIWQQAIALLFVGALVSGCATSSDRVTAAYISPITYKKYSCAQIRQEAARVSQEVASLAGVQEKKAENDAVATGVALVLFWPAAFFVGGDDHTTAELAQMKGKFNALKAESERKRCGIKFQAFEPEDPDEKPRARKRRDTYRNNY